ncbi:hypothetical protein AMJ80_06465 [bacterium SM23_31]|nr:MAG: hypothetical protein AMJ80_06465 [bacterium SM23_31]
MRPDGFPYIRADTRVFNCIRADTRVCPYRIVVISCFYTHAHPFISKIAPGESFFKWFTSIVFEP